MEKPKIWEWTSGEGEQREEEKELEKYLERRAQRKREQREKFCALFLHSLRLRLSMNWWRFPTLCKFRCAITIPLCSMLLCASGLSVFLSFPVLFSSPNLVLFLSFHALPLGALWTGRWCRLLFPATIGYTLFSVLAFAHLLFALPAMAFGDGKTKIHFPQLVPLLPLLAWTSKSLWEAYLVVKWRTKWRDDNKMEEKVPQKVIETRTEEHQQLIGDRHAMLIRRAMAEGREEKGPPKEHILVKWTNGTGRGRRRRAMIVHKPKRGQKTRRNGENEKKPEPRPKEESLYEIYARFVRPEQWPEPDEVLVYTSRGFVRKKRSEHEYEMAERGGEEEEKGGEEIQLIRGEEDANWKESEEGDQSFAAIKWPDLLSRLDLSPSTPEAAPPLRCPRGQMTEV